VVSSRRRATDRPPKGVGKTVLADEKSAGAFFYFYFNVLGIGKVPSEQKLRGDGTFLAGLSLLNGYRQKCRQIEPMP
jgi:hypothetical protein